MFLHTDPLSSFGRDHQLHPTLQRDVQPGQAAADVLSVGEPRMTPGTRASWRGLTEMARCFLWKAVEIDK